MATSSDKQWSSHRAFLLAAIGVAVGLGNIWRFPYITGVNGGGAFVLVYCLAVAVLGVPLAMAEIAIGRRGGGSAVASMRKLTGDEGSSPFWQVVGWQAILAPIAGLMYYTVVAGWTLDFAVSALGGAFDGVTDAASAGAVFGALTADIPRMMLSHGIFMGLTVFIVAAGIRNGLERAVKSLMPALFGILVVLVAYSALTADFMGGLRYLFRPDFSKVTSEVVLMAIGQAFFSLAVAVGALITYGAYMPKGVSIPRVAGILAAADTLVAILMGLVIFPLVLSYGLEPGEGPGLVFVTLPIAFGQMPAGWFFGGLFFTLMAIAAITSTIGMLEPPVAWLVEHRGFQRAPSAIGLGVLMWLCGIPALLSFNRLADFQPIGGRNIFGLMDYFTANLVIPIGGFLLAVYAGWGLTSHSLRDELGLQGSPWFGVLQLILRFVAPIAIAAIFVSTL